MKITINWIEHEISELEAIRLLLDLKSREQFPKWSDVKTYKTLSEAKEKHVTKKIAELREQTKMSVDTLWQCIGLNRITTTKRLLKWWWSYSDLLIICYIFQIKLSDLEDWRALPPETDDESTL